MDRNQGFTLLEVLIAITILAVLTAYTSQNIIKSSRDKIRLQKEIDRDSKLQNAVRLIERDINLAFHYRDVNEEIEKAVKEKSEKGAGTAAGSAASGGGGVAGSGVGTDPAAAAGAGGAGATPPVKLEFEPKKYEQFTQFIGTENSMNFTALSHIRLMQDSQESEQEEVGYFIQSCRPRGMDKNVDCLWRRSTPYIDKDVTKGGAEVVLLENVKVFKLRYYGEDKMDWVSAWRTDQGGDAATTDRFPLAVELTLTAEDQGKDSTLSAVIPLHFPNNKTKEEVSNPSATNPGQPPPPPSP